MLNEVHQACWDSVESDFRKETIAARTRGMKMARLLSLAIAGFEQASKEGCAIPEEVFALRVKLILEVYGFDD